MYNITPTSYKSDLKQILGTEAHNMYMKLHQTPDFYSSTFKKQ